MEDSSEIPLIKPEDIIRKGDEVIVGLGSLDQHIRTRGKLFFSRLGAISMDNNSLGWQKITKSDNGGTEKTPSTANIDATFTGRLLCSFASLAVYEALKDRVKDVKLDVVVLDTDVNGEMWDDPNYKLKPYMQHIMVKAEDQITRQVRYYDPTYRQVNHKTEGTIHSFAAEELEKYYRFREGRYPKDKPIEPVRVTPSGRPLENYEKKEIREWYQSVGLTEEKRQALIRTLQ